MSQPQHAYFQIAAKAIVYKDNKILLLITPKGLYDFPGGRMAESEAGLGLPEVLAREVREELGDSFHFEAGSIAFASNRSYMMDGREQHILATFYEVSYAGGEVQLSDEHTEYQWVEPASLLSSPDKFVSADEYEQFRQYCLQRPSTR